MVPEGEPEQIKDGVVVQPLGLLDKDETEVVLLEGDGIGNSNKVGALWKHENLKLWS